MKLSKIIVLFSLFVLQAESLLAQDMLTFLDGALSFQRPPDVTLWEERPSMTDPSHRNFWWGRIRLTVNIYDEQVLRTRASADMNRAVHNLIHNNDPLSRNALLDLFAAKPEFVIFPCTPRVEVRSSYKRLMYDGITIGESFFHANALNLEARGNFGYLTSIIVKNRIVNINLSLFTGEENNPLRQLDGYTVTRDSVLLWLDDKAPTFFYEHLSSDRYKEMPLILQQLREAHDIIMQTLRIRQDDSYISNINVISPSLEFQRTHVTARNLRLQERIDEHAQVIQVLPEGTDVQVIMVSEFMGTRIGVPFPWVIVTTREGFVGWVFSGHLSPVEDSIEHTVIEYDSSAMGVDNDLMLNNAGDIVANESGRVGFWLLLVLLVPLIFVVVFFVKKIRR